MRNRKIIFDKKENAILTAQDLATEDLTDNEILIKTQYSVISPGTELAIYQDRESWAPLPYNPGYAAIGKVAKTGTAVEGITSGDYLLTYTPHSEYSVISKDCIHLKLQDNENLKETVFTRLAAVSISALRVSNVELGDKVAVFGLGLIGNLAAQLFQLSGADVTGIDICEKRMAIAKECGINNVLDAREKSIDDELSGFDVTVEATGNPQIVLNALKVTGKRGEVILLGSPRGEYRDNIVDILNQVHLWDNGCINLKGAHEWRYPKKPSEGCKHSIERNCRIIVKMIAENKLIIKPLITHITNPTKAQDAYQGLLNQKNNYLGVVFDWVGI